MGVSGKRTTLNETTFTSHPTKPILFTKKHGPSFILLSIWYYFNINTKWSVDSGLQRDHEFGARPKKPSESRVSEIRRRFAFSPSLPLLKQLHWLPVSYRINFKLSTLAYRALSTQQPSYLASLLHLSNIPRQLRSSTSQQLIVPKTKLNLGKRAFSVAAPRVWNELPITLKTSETIAIFRKKLKTYLFQIAFPP